MRSILYDFITFNSTQKNYDTYKREFLTRILFIDKYEQIFNDKKTATIHTNHKSLISFMNADEHENIYAR